MGPSGLPYVSWRPHKLHQHGDGGVHDFLVCCALLFSDISRSDVSELVSISSMQLNVTFHVLLMCAHLVIE